MPKPTKISQISVEGNPSVYYLDLVISDNTPMSIILHFEAAINCQNKLISKRQVSVGMSWLEAYKLQKMLQECILKYSGKQTNV